MMKMIKKRLPVTVYVIAAGMLLAAAAVISNRDDQQAARVMLPVALRTVKMSDGWGYEVLVDKKVFIHQDCIPAIPSFKKFSTEADAWLIGSRVVDKIRKGRKPAVSLQEIADARIHF